MGATNDGASAPSVTIDLQAGNRRGTPDAKALTMSTRFRFSPEFARAVQIRGLTLTDVARRAGVAVATASAAARGNAINVSTAIRLSKAVAAAPILPELEAWAGSPEGTSRGTRDHATSPSSHLALEGSFSQEQSRRLIVD